MPELSIDAEELVKALLSHGAKADVVNAYGSSPLAEAVRVANMSLAGMLLDAGADPNRANEDGETPVMLAARTGAVKVAELLVRHGGNVNTVRPTADFKYFKPVPWHKSHILAFHVLASMLTGWEGPR